MDRGARRRRFPQKCFDRVGESATFRAPLPVLELGQPLNAGGPPALV